MVGSFHDQNRRLIQAGKAKDVATANALRAKLKSEGQTVDQFLAAEGKSTSLGVVTSHSSEMGEIRALMHQDGLGFQEASLLRSQIIAGGHTVADYIVADAQFGSAGGEDAKAPALAQFRAAGTLIRLAGGVDEAKKAIDAFSSLEEGP